MTGALLLDGLGTTELVVVLIATAILTPACVWVAMLWADRRGR